jgi:glycosyltransferase involved in cell wall biosynthesis
MKLDVCIMLVPASDMRRLCFVMTSPFALNAFLRPHLERLSANSDITVCVNMDDPEVAPVVPGHVQLVPLRIARQISVWSDLRTLFELFCFFRRQRFDLVCSLTPKGGLLAMLAGRLAGAQLRVHCFTGQVWATRRGFGRWLLKSMDRLLAACATRLLADSASQRLYLIEEGIVAPGKIEVLANGSMAGVDMQRFRPDENVRRQVRSRLGIGEDACCLLYVGRLKRDKGIPDLVEAFNRLRPRFPNLHLLLVGPDEEGLDLLFRGIPHLHRVGYTQTAEEYMAAADIFCLPSYREGFGLVLIEAGAAGLPVVASRIYGITDAVIEGETGLLHQPGDIGDLTWKLESLFGDASLRKRLGEAGRSRATAMFRTELVTGAMADFLQSQLDASQRD